MAAEVFLGQPATYFGENDAFLPDHDWDKPLPKPEDEESREIREGLAQSIGSKAHFLATEWGPGISPRAGHIKAPEYPPEYMQQ